MCVLCVSVRVCVCAILCVLVCTHASVQSPNYFKMKLDDINHLFNMPHFKCFSVFFSAELHKIFESINCWGGGGGKGSLLKIVEKSSRYLKMNLMLTRLLTGLPVSHT